MKQNKQSKVVAILALCVSVLGLSLGFAAFSNTLTISSSATVSPDESDFDINVYGYTGDWGDDFEDVNLYSSSTISHPVSYSQTETATDAKITDKGKSIVISDLAANLSVPGDGINYYFMIKNEGEYDAYLDLTKLESFVSEKGVNHTCIAGTGTTVELVNEACGDVTLNGYFTGKDYEHIDPSINSYKLSKGSYMFLNMYIDYGYQRAWAETARADGDFSVNFDDIVLDFSSVPSSE